MARERAAYEKYLLTPWWRSRRDRALALAGWTCARCRSKRKLEVHHLSYERLGAEFDADLQVLCAKCHKERHIQEREASEHGIYLKIVREALNANRWGTIGDISDGAKVLCATRHIAYDGPEIHHAIALLTNARRAVITVPTWNVGNENLDAAAVTAEVAHEILTDLGIQTGDVIKTLPDGFLPHESSVREQVRQLRVEIRALGAPLPSWVHATSAQERIWRERREIERMIRCYDGEAVPALPPYLFSGDERVQRERAEIDRLVRRYQSEEGR